MKSKIKHYDLKLEKPDFDSPLVELIITLDCLRNKEPTGSTPPQIFQQLKNIFHMMESIGSARIEGNNTTIFEYIETKIDKPSSSSQSIKEIQNLEEAMNFIEKHVRDYPINRAFISELHKIVVGGLSPDQGGEGDRTPGQYRKIPIQISHSKHLPPDSYPVIEEYMEELFHFVNKSDSPQYDLLKIAIAHHRFVWIHPFRNGNGRTVRLLTYAMLIKSGFKVDSGRIINPTAIFCNNRSKYYKFLEKADSGKSSDILAWCEYMLKGLKTEIEKIDKLADYSFLKKEVLFPIIRLSQQKKYLSDIEAKILNLTIDKELIQSSDLKEIFPNKLGSEISRQLRKLVEKKLLEKKGGRHYSIIFKDNYLLRFVAEILGKKGFLPNLDKEKLR